MEWFIVSGYAAICVIVFTFLRLPLNRWTVPSATIGGIVLSFALIQLLNFYHPYSGNSQQHLTIEPVASEAGTQESRILLAREDRRLIAWFPEKTLLRLKHGNEAEVAFASIPGRVFSGLVQAVDPVSDDEPGMIREASANTDGQRMIPVLIDITDRRYAGFVAQIPNGAHARAAVYGEDMQDLALVRKTLMRMSAWMNYLTAFS